ncbi:hypothetical protein J25TS5_17850 [Paenibacillus faecis]|uniref:copper amine oxidase N-terminal domain-containing protein n=1 Tax=Paenibacillus faecis TaxID=862114 RepID=UPI001B2DF818|nr:copper amine oxidase N-terminal domain-containing protein [Paenibacillus faecis]GIO84853.1 hypothetical protein J25TS5_17850 [Paenibacillus faecis]
MRKRAVLGAMAILFLLSSASVSAHPGRTDAKGGHYCRTNCAKWGLEDGEYHYHNGGRSSSQSKSKVPSASSTSKSKKKTTTKTSTRKTPSADYAKSSLKVFVNGQAVAFNNTPVIYQSTNLVPLREMAEGMGAAVNLDKDGGTIVVSKDTSSVTMTIGSKTVTYNGETETVSAAPKVIKGVTYMPAQVLARGLGASLEFDSDNHSLKITLP